VCLIKALFVIGIRLVRLAVLAVLAVAFVPPLLMGMVARRFYRRFDRRQAVSVLKHGCENAAACARQAAAAGHEVVDATVSVTRRIGGVLLETVCGAAGVGLLVKLAEPGDREAFGLGILVGAAIGLVVGLANHLPRERLSLSESH